MSSETGFKFRRGSHREVPVIAHRLTRHNGGQHRADPMWGEESWSVSRSNQDGGAADRNRQSESAVALSTVPHF